jgi:Flp pilus assembly pilin Flp
MSQQFLLFVIAVLLVAIFWELCKINGRLKRSLSSISGISGGGQTMTPTLRKFWADDEGQDIAEYAVMLAVILVLVVGTIRLVGANANNAFSSVSSSLQ